MDRLPTGVSVLDRELGGGLPAGTVVLLKADPASQSELFLNTFTGVRETRYLTSVRSVEGVEAALDRSAVGADNADVRAIHGETPLDDAANEIEDLSEGSTLIVDSLEPLEEAQPEQYRRFLVDLRERTAETGSLTVLHALDAAGRSRNRVVSEQVADVVFDLRTRVTGTDVENRLVMAKFRGGVALDEPLKLKLTDSVTVDTSRDIA